MNAGTSIERIASALASIPPGGHDDRVKIGMALKAELGESGRELWDNWRGDRGGDEASSVWKSLSEAGPVGIGSLFHEAKANGWRDDGTHQAPTPEELAERKRVSAERAAADAEAIERERTVTATKAAAIWKAATEAGADHPYLVRKQVAPTDTLREIGVDVAAGVLGYTPKARGEALTGRLLAVPVRQGDRLSTVELIDGAGRKTALSGRGTKASGFWATSKLPDGDGAGVILLIGEGVATCLSATQATGHPGIAALSSGNLPAVAKSMRDRYPAAAIVLLADLDKATGAPDRHATETTQAVGGKLAVPDFGPDREPGWTDFNDLAVTRGPEAVARAIAAALTDSASVPDATDETGETEQAATEAEDDDAIINRLAGLSIADYDRQRAAAAEGMGIRASTLDKLVGQTRKDSETAGIGFDDVEPWPNTVDHAALLSEIAATIQRFIICQPESADAAALWAAMTWYMDAVQVAPLAVITAPEKRCGKSQLLFLLGKLTFRPLTASNITPSALFRSIDAWNPTLLIDEADAFMKENEELRGLLNCGHTRDSAYIIRTVGEAFTPTRFNVWGAKALAGIGHLAETLMDRAITIELRRKLPHEEVARLRHAEPGLFDDLASKLARMANDAREQVRRARPHLPEQLNDRAQDNWEPLLAIAEVAGGEWPKRARDAALKLSGATDATLSIGAELLADIQEVFAQKRVDRISTADLIAALCADDEQPWNTFNRGRPIAPRQMAKRLKEYGIHSRNISVGYQQSKGFDKSQFEEAFARYLSPPGKMPSTRPISPEALSSNEYGWTDKKTQDGCKNASVQRKPLQNKALDGWTDKNPEKAGFEKEVRI